MTLTYQGVELYTFNTVEPQSASLGVYCVAANGNCFAIQGNNACLAVAEHAVSQYLTETTGLHPYGRVYVIWQPKNHTQTVWETWVKKWAARTANGRA
jgi:hypothetical protein